MSAHLTTDEVLDGHDLGGRRVVVTGSSGGLGLETSRSLAAHGANVVMAARDRAKNEAAADSIRDRHPDAEVEPVDLDLTRLTSVSDCADAIAAGGQVDVLIGNAGVMGCPFETTSDGFEMQFGVNHLGHFLLAARLAPAIPDAGRVVILSSGAHVLCDVDLDDPNFERRDYDKWAAYGQSKTANALHAVELNRRLARRGIRAASVHPGVIPTDLSRHLDEADFARLADRRKASTSESDSETEKPSPLQYKSVEQGAATSVWAAVTPDLDRDGGGVYCEDCHVARLREPDSPPGIGVEAYALHPETAAALWARSEELVGEVVAW